MDIETTLSFTLCSLPEKLSVVFFCFCFIDVSLMHERMYHLRILVISSSITFEILLSELINSGWNGRLSGEVEAVKRGIKSGKNEYCQGELMNSGCGTDGCEGGKGR